MREVKALAMLDHSGIVRYYQAWFESPPPGWQEDKDRLTLDTSSSMLSTAVFSSSGTQSVIPHKTHQPTLDKVTEDSIPYIQPEIKTSDIEKLRENPLNPFGLKAEFNPLRPFGGVDDWSQSEPSEHEAKRQGSTEEFRSHARFFPDLDSDSDSISLGISAPGLHKDNSLVIEFVNSDTDASNNAATEECLPFDNYNVLDNNLNDSFSIVFEDSGCGDKSEKSKSSSDDIEDVGYAQDSSWVEKEEDDSGSKSLSRSPELQLMSRSPAKSFSTSPPKNKSLSKAKSSNQTVLSTSPNRPKALELVEYKPLLGYFLPTPTPTSKLYLYIQMQLCRKESLKDWLHANTLNRDRLQLLDIFDQIVSAVDYIHDNGLMHRDLKVTIRQSP